MTNTQQFPLWQGWPDFLKSWAPNVPSSFENLDSVVDTEPCGKLWPYSQGPLWFSFCTCKTGNITSHFTRHNSLIFVKCFQILGYWALDIYICKEQIVNLHDPSPPLWSLNKNVQINCSKTWKCKWHLTNSGQFAMCVITSVCGFSKGECST